MHIQLLNALPGKFLHEFSKRCLEPLGLWSLTFFISTKSYQHETGTGFLRVSVREHAVCSDDAIKLG